MSFARRQAMVTADADRYDEQAMLKALQKAGFGGKVQKGKKE